MKVIFPIKKIAEVAEKIILQKPHKIIVFNGEMGAGKTTLIKEICKNLGVLETTSSPTFSIINEYLTYDNQFIYHFDFYRLNSEIEALDLGVEEYFYSGYYCFIEWAEKIPSLIPENHTKIDISVLENGDRELIVS